MGGVRKLSEDDYHVARQQWRQSRGRGANDGGTQGPERGAVGLGHWGGCPLLVPGGQFWKFYVQISAF